jgi:CDP-diacylglycerol--glycerol-3-phosphate 3-phosphatidyltransferase
MNVADERRAMFNLANQLTMSRLLLSFVLFVLIAYELWLACVVVVVVAAITDWLDGFVARLQNSFTALGRMLDPLIDKVLVCGAFIFLLPIGMKEGWLWPWMVVVVVSREFLITGLRSYFESLGVQFGADILGKIKMTLQCICLPIIFLGLSLGGDILAWARDLSIWAMLAATIGSGLQYIIRGVSILSREVSS